MTKYVLNALIPPEGGEGLMKISRATIDEVRNAIEEGALCYIGHPYTARLLNVIPNRGEAKLKTGDIAYVLRLRFRTERSGQEVVITERDLEVLKVEYLEK